MTPFRLPARAAALLAALAMVLPLAPAAADETEPTPTPSATAPIEQSDTTPPPDVVVPPESPSPPDTDSDEEAEPSQPPSPVASEPGPAIDPLDGADLSGQGAWRRDSTGWWYRLNDGSYPTSTWATIDGAVYSFDSAGYMRTGWIQDDGSWFYLRASGQRAEGWTNVRGSWYYLSDDHGRMLISWVPYGGSWYFLRADGTMATGWLRESGSWYYLHPNGAMATGWLRDGGSWYYLDPNGVMVTGQYVINGTSEQFTDAGVWYGYHVPTGYLQPTDHITSLGWATNDLTWGMNGIKVRIVQQRLGIWSSGTLASVNATFQTAVRNFQARAGLPQTGVVDRATWEAMGTGYSWWVDQYQATPISLSATRSERIEAMIGYAWNQIGSSYTWGGAGPYPLGFDCSGLVLQSLYAAGMDPQPINVHRHQWPDYRTSQELYAYSGFQHVPFSQRQRGDLIFYTTNGVVTHVAIYLGDDQVVHTSWMGRPARMDHVTAGYSWSTIAPVVVRPFP